MKAYLILTDGTIFEGKSIGKVGEAIGEVVFTTTMNGYMETLTDPSYYGQMVAQTFPLIGNYGVIPLELENLQPSLSGYIIRELCDIGSNYRKEGELEEFLVKYNVVGIADIDTRALTRKIRNIGAMNGMISPDKNDLEIKIKKLKQYKIVDAVKNTSSKEVKIYNEKGKNKVVLWDFGALDNTEKILAKHDLEVITVPYNTTAEQILSYSPDGIVLSNGPGNPSENKDAISELTKLNKKGIPTMGICLGHQLLALSYGGSTYKLKHGHRGSNQPVKDLKTGRVYITSQNHGYAVDEKSMDTNIFEPRFVSVNDSSSEGIDYKNAPAFSVQFQPEISSGAQDTECMFERFIKIMRGVK